MSDKSNRQYRDTVFRHMFTVRPDWALELCGALVGADFPPDTPIRECGAKTGLLGMRRDLAFEVGGRLVFMVEHQSSPCMNMPMRFLRYFADLVFALFLSGAELLGGRLREMPGPRFFVLYDGAEKFPDKLRLSDAFLGRGMVPPWDAPPLELVVEVVKIGRGAKSPALGRCAPLKGYARLVGLIEEGVKAGGSRDAAISGAVAKCIGEGTLKEYLEEYHKEVAEMFGVNYTFEDEIEARKHDAFEEGIEKGIEQGARGMIATAFKENYPAEVIESMRRNAGLTKEQLEELRAEALAV